MQTLDDAYANAAYIPNAHSFILQWAKAAKMFRGLLKKEGRADCNVFYGPTDRQKFDVFSPIERSEDIFILSTVVIGCALINRIGHILPPAHCSRGGMWQCPLTTSARIYA